MRTLNLAGKWKVRDMPLACKGASGLKRVTKTRSGWLPAKVPGEIHLDLMRAGCMEEPLLSLNAKKSRWPEKRSWWFTRSFEVTSPFLQHECQQLVFEGLDLYAQVFLNGEFVGESKNAFVPCILDVRHRLKRRNKLVVRLTSGEEMVDESLRLKGSDREKRQAFRGISHLRKPQFTYGWDWVDVLPNIGIWRAVRLEGHSGITLHDVSFNTRLHDGAASLDVSTVVENLHPWSERSGEVVVSLAPPKGRALKRRLKLAAPVGRSTVQTRFDIPKPKLWWPNGMADQPLYHATVQVFHEGRECDRRVMDIGLRTVEIDRTPIPTRGSRFCIKVNGLDVFCKGGNWIPADAIIARVDTRKYETLIADAKNANLNMLRIWGGGVYESPDFYRACDRAGILVWQDFMFACSEYPDHDPEFREAVRAEAEATIRQLRHHPCIALWCGNNENTWGFADWWNKGKDIHDRDLKLGGSAIYNEVLPDLCRTLDPTRPYWPGSPFGGETPNSETDGDCHWWPQGTMNRDMTRRIRHEVYDECTSRFVSEYGVIGYCHLDSIREYLKPDELQVDSQAWKEHTNVFENKTIPAAIQYHYADLDGLNLSDRILYGQLFQATMYGRSIEALRFRKHDRRDDCQGALIWMYNDCWGETGWTPIDYYLRRKPSYYWIRNACTPVKAIVRRRGSRLVVRVVNDSLQPLDTLVHYGWMRVDGMEARMQTEAMCIPANAMVEVRREAIPAKKRMHPREWIFAAYLTGEGVETCPSIWTLLPYRQLATSEPEITTVVKGDIIELVSDLYCHAVHVDDDGRRLLSDNYFDLLPGVPKKVNWLAHGIPKKLRFRSIVQR